MCLGRRYPKLLHGRATVRAADISRHERIMLETRMAKDLERLLGGREAAVALCLAAAAQDASAAVALSRARAQAEATVHKTAGLQRGHFTLQAWHAQDL